MNENYNNEIINMIWDYFANNPDSNTYELPKGVLTAKLNIGQTKAETISKVFCNEYAFAQNGRGKLIIDKRKFDMWSKLNDELQSQEITKDEIEQNYPILSKTIEEHGKKLKEWQGKMTQMQDEIKSLQIQIQKVEETSKGLPEQIKVLRDKKTQIELENKKMQEERAKEVKEMQELQKKDNQRMLDEENNRNWLVRRPITEYDYGHSPIWWFGVSFICFILWLCVVGIINFFI